MRSDIWREIGLHSKSLYIESEVIDYMLKRTLSSSTILILVAILLFPFSATAKDDQVGYSVQALIPENQLDNKHSYFDLLTEPNQEQELEVIIYNNENEDIVVRITVNHE